MGGICDRDCSEFQEAVCPGTDGDCLALPDETIQIKDVRRMNVKPGDRLVVTLPGEDVPQSVRECRIKSVLRAFADVFPSNMVVVVYGDAKISVFDKDQGEGVW